jgi:FixJ family two-component response regulator
MDASVGMSQSPTVCVIDDDDGFRTGMTRMLQLSGLPAVGYRGAGEFLIAQHENGIACILLDISMPGPSGIDLLRALVLRDEAPPVIFTTGHDDVFTSVDVMKAGAFDYIVKPVSAARILPSVRRAMELDAEQRATRARLQELRSRYESLTAAEQTIFHGIVRSKLNKQLAVELGACERTVKAQRARMMGKLSVTTVPELVRVAKTLEEYSRRIGLIALRDPDSQTRMRLGRPPSTHPLRRLVDA